MGDKASTVQTMFGFNCYDHCLAENPWWWELTAATATGKAAWGKKGEWGNWISPAAVIQSGTGLRNTWSSSIIESIDGGATQTGWLWPSRDLYELIISWIDDET